MEEQRGGEKEMKGVREKNEKEEKGEYGRNFFAHNIKLSTAKPARTVIQKVKFHTESLQATKMNHFSSQ